MYEIYFNGIESLLPLVLNEKAFLLTSEQPKRYILDRVIRFVMHSIIFFDSLVLALEFYRQIVGFPMGADCCPLIADLVFVLRLYVDSF